MSDDDVPDLSTVEISYDRTHPYARVSIEGHGASGLAERLRLFALSHSEGRQISPTQLDLPWPLVLEILREFGSSRRQRELGFRFKLLGDAMPLARQFAQEASATRAAGAQLPLVIDEAAVDEKLSRAGFVLRKLRAFQMRDLIRLTSLAHGANFSVPGAGKTTVTLALHIVARPANEILLVVCPKTAFPAWKAVVGECIDSNVSGALDEQFTILDGDQNSNLALLDSGKKRFAISYDLMIRQQTMLTNFFARRPVHLVLDEAHRMKAGLESQRGAFLLNIAPLVARRDILTGTPMPQGPSDIASQLQFLWPGQGLEGRIQRSEPPRSVLGNLYVRTTKAELDLPKAKRHFIDVDMSPGQLALYSLVKSEVLRSLTQNVRQQRGAVDFASARRSVMRLLQLSANPILAIRGIERSGGQVTSGVIQSVIEEGTSTKIKKVVEDARQLAAGGNKVVIWTIFTESLLELEALLADLNPVTLYGAVPSGHEDDLEVREGRLKRFHEDPACMALIANPAAAGEGISLHTVCHNALYLDRSYVATHYLQSIDRIHRLGLKKGVETDIHIYRTRAPAGLGSIDMSVSRRLALKIRGLQQLLDDVDLHEIALDEENAVDPLDYSVDIDDLVDLIDELEGRHQDADTRRDSH